MKRCKYVMSSFIQQTFVLRCETTRRSSINYQNYLAFEISKIKGLIARQGSAQGVESCLFRIWHRMQTCWSEKGLRKGW